MENENYWTSIERKLSTRGTLTPEIKAACSHFSQHTSYDYQMSEKLRSERADLMVQLKRDGYSLIEIGDLLGVTRERVRQLIKRTVGPKAFPRARRLRSYKPCGHCGTPMEKRGMTRAFCSKQCRNAAAAKRASSKYATFTFKCDNPACGKEMVKTGKQVFAHEYYGLSRWFCTRECYISTLKGVGIGNDEKYSRSEAARERARRYKQAAADRRAAERNRRREPSHEDIVGTVL